jgi:hypothetical protein
MSRSHQIKFQRAQDHLEQLERRIAEWQKQVGTSVFGELDPEDARFQIFYFQNDPVPDEKLSATIGDVVQNLRASLDHLCFELATGFKGRLTKKQERSAGFPIHRSEAELREASPDLLGLVGSEAAAIIQRLQPYSSRPDKKEAGDLLWQLHELVVADQRETLALVNTVVGRWSVESILPYDFDPVGTWFRTGVPPKGRAPIARLPLLPEGTEEEVIRKITSSLDVALADPPSPSAGDPIHIVLTDMAEYIQTRVFKALEPLLPTSRPGK